MSEISTAQDMLQAANSSVRNALTVRHDNPRAACRLLIRAADTYEQLELINLSQTALEYAWEIQCDHLGGADLDKFAELLRDCRLRSFAKFLTGSEA